MEKKRLSLRINFSTAYKQTDAGETEHNKKTKMASAVVQNPFLFSIVAKEHNILP